MFFEESGTSLIDFIVVVIHFLSSERRIVVAGGRRRSKLLPFCWWFSRCVALNGLKLSCHFCADSANNIIEFRSGDEVLAEVGVGSECCYRFVDNFLDLSGECIVDEVTNGMFEVLLSLTHFCLKLLRLALPFRFGVGDDFLDGVFIKS